MLTILEVVTPGVPPFCPVRKQTPPAYPATAIESPGTRPRSPVTSREWMRRFVSKAEPYRYALGGVFSHQQFFMLRGISGGDPNALGL